MPGLRLGCLDEIQIFITSQCGAPKLCELNATTVHFNRVLDDISQAEVTVPLSDVGDLCCRCIAEVEPYCHELHIIRNGEIGFSGPVIDVTIGYEGATIFAKDVLAWLQVRIPIVPLNNTKKFPNGQEITDIAVEVLDGALAEHDPCVLQYVLQTDKGNDAYGKSIRPTKFAHTKVSPQNGFPASNGTYFDWLQNLSQIGLDYTVIGRRVILGIETTHIASLGTLTDEHIMGEVQVSKKGSQMANRVYVRYQDDDTDAQCLANNPNITTAPCPAVVEASGANAPNTVCYGPIERLLNDGVPFDWLTASSAGVDYVEAGQVAPRTITFPSGTKLSPDTPWEFNDMIPGQKINVALTELCLSPIFQSFRLLEVNYSVVDGGDEEISITLGPFNNIGST